MVHEVRVALADVRIGQLLVYGEGLRLFPFTVLIVETFLCDLTDIDLRVEVRCEGVVVVTGVAVDDVEIVDLVEVVLGSVGCVSLRSHPGRSRNRG
jgi:hypothetical protein